MMTDHDDKRPEWGFSIPMSTFKKLLSGVTKITSETKFKSVDSWENYRVIHTNKGKVREPEGFLDFFDYSRVMCGQFNFFDLTYLGEKAERRLEKIKEYDTEHRDDIIKFNELKEKLGL